MKKYTLGVCIAVLAGVTGAATAQTTMKPVAKTQLNVTDGVVKQAGKRLAIDAPEVRAVLNSGLHRRAEIRFTYLGPTSVNSKLGDAEVRNQFGLKLRAQDICNLV